MVSWPVTRRCSTSGTQLLRFGFGGERHRRPVAGLARQRRGALLAPPTTCTTTDCRAHRSSRRISIWRMSGGRSGRREQGIAHGRIVAEALGDALEADPRDLGARHCRAASGRRRCSPTSASAADTAPETSGREAIGDLQRLRRRRDDVDQLGVDEDRRARRAPARRSRSGRRRASGARGAAPRGLDASASARAKRTSGTDRRGAPSSPPPCRSASPRRRRNGDRRGPAHGRPRPGARPAPFSIQWRNSVNDHVGFRCLPPATVVNDRFTMISRAAPALCGCGNRRRALVLDGSDSGRGTRMAGLLFRGIRGRPALPPRDPADRDRDRQHPVLGPDPQSAAAPHRPRSSRHATEWGQPLMNSLFTLGLMIGISVNDTTIGTIIANLGMTEVQLPASALPGRHRIGDHRGDGQAAVEVAARRRHRRVRAQGLQPDRRDGRDLPAPGMVRRRARSPAGSRA